MNKVKGIFVNNIHIFCAKRLLRNKKVLTVLSVRTLLFYSDIHINVYITPA
jgi:hypothetical protein